MVCQLSGCARSLTREGRGPLVGSGRGRAAAQVARIRACLDEPTNRERDPRLAEVPAPGSGDQRFCAAKLDMSGWLHILRCRLLCAVRRGDAPRVLRCPSPNDTCSAAISVPPSTNLCTYYQSNTTIATERLLPGRNMLKIKGIHAPV